MEPRQIKFRAWAQIFRKDYRMIERDEICMKWNLYRFTHPNEHGFVLMQFTGLLDKNGKEIYEGDIVIWETVSLKPREVRFKDGAFHLDSGNTVNTFFSDNINPEEEVLVIGNIFESPNLSNPMIKPEPKITDFIQGIVSYDRDGQYFWVTMTNGGVQMLGELRGWGHI